MFNRLPDVSRLAQQGKTQKLIRFLGSDRGLKKNGKDRERVLDEAMRTLGAMETAQLLPFLEEAAAKEDNLSLLCRIAILAANLGEIHLYQKAYCPRYSATPKIAEKETCVQLEVRYLNDQAMHRVVAWMGEMLAPEKHQDVLVQYAAEHLRRLYAAVTEKDTRKRIQAYEGTVLKRAEKHVDTHVDKGQSEETAYSGWFCDHNDAHHDQHTDIATKPAEFFQL